MTSESLKEQLADLHPEAFGWALCCCRRDEDEAAEVLQASYLKVLDGRARFAGRSTFRTWLFGVIRRTAWERRRPPAMALDFLRRVGLAPWLAPGALEREDAQAAVQRSQESARLRAALDRLTRRQREILHLVFYQEMTIAEAAAVIGLRVGTARTHYERGKRALRRLLREPVAEASTAPQEEGG